MNIKKTIWIAALMALFPFFLHAQGHFDWVKSYFGPDHQGGGAANEIFGSVQDHDGNVYILGQFIGGAKWDDGTDILPFSAHRNRCAIIAKFTPQGEMVWHKELYSSYTDIEAYTIRMVGDTALMLYAWFMFPFDYDFVIEKNELYYFDTLLTTSERFPKSPDSLQTPNFYYSLITLGLENGNIIEEHFLTLNYVKNDGSMLRDKYYGYLSTNRGIRVSFNVDNEGNILLARHTNDLMYELCDTCPDGLYYWSPNEGNLSTMRLMVDGATKQLDVPLEPSSLWNWQIIKLSPHLDSVIASTYVFDSTWRYSPNENISLILHSIDIDANNNIYLIPFRSQNPPDRMPVKNSDTLTMDWYSCMIRYNSELIPTGLVQVTALHTPEGYCVGSLTFINTYYDSETNSLFLNGTSGRDPQYTTLSYNGEALNLMNNACWLRLNADDLSLVSYGKARSAGTRSYERTYLYSDKYSWSHNGSFVTKNNRVFCQVEYQRNILFEDNQISNPYGMGLFVWDYDGHELEYIDYNSNSDHNQQAYIFLKDSNLFLSGTLTASADFGDIHLHVSTNSHAYLTRYTDTAFMVPYVYIDPHPEHIDETEQQGCQIYPNPTNDILFINVSGEYISNVYITSLQGKRMELKIYGNKVSLSNVPSGIYYLQVITNRNTYQQKIIKI